MIDPGRAFGTGRARDDAALPRAPAQRAGPGQPARRRLRLGRALDRGREARLRARCIARRQRPARRRGDERERGGERSRGRVRLADAHRGRAAAADTAVANIALEPSSRLAPRLERRRSITSGYLVSREPRPPRLPPRRSGASRRLGGRPARARSRVPPPMATSRSDFLGCKVSHTDAQAVRERLLADGHAEPATAPTSRSSTRAASPTRRSASRATPPRGRRAPTRAST